MGADNDAHYVECHIDTLEVGIADEAAYSKIVSRRRVIRSGRSTHHSNRLDELKNSSSDHNSLSSKLGKRRAKVSGKSIFLKILMKMAVILFDILKERTQIPQGRWFILK